MQEEISIITQQSDVTFEYKDCDEQVHFVNRVNSDDSVDVYASTTNYSVSQLRGAFMESYKAYMRVHGLPVAKLILSDLQHAYHAASNKD